MQPPRVQSAYPLDLSDAALLDKYGDGGAADNEATSAASDGEASPPSSSASPIAKKKKYRGSGAKSKGGNKTTARNQREKATRAASIYIECVRLALGSGLERVVS